MDTYIKILVFLAVIGLSIGPLSYFFGTGSSNQIPYNESDDENLVTTLSGNATGTIMEIRPYISYVGVAGTNNESFVREIMTYVNYTDNYTLSVSLNPYGEGYRYEMFVPLHNYTDAMEVGFKTKLNMDPFFSDSYTTVLSTIQLSDSFVANGTFVQAGDKTATAVMLYSRQKGEEAVIYCSQLIVTEAGALVNNPSLCVDTSTGYKYGLSISDYLLMSDEFNKTMELNVSLIDHVEIEGNFTGILNETQLRKDTGQELLVSNPYDENGTGTISMYLLDAENSTLISSMELYLKEKGVKLTRTTKIGVAFPPSEIDLNGEKRLSHIPYVAVRMPLTALKGVRSVDVNFVMILGEVAEMNAV